MNHNEVKGRHPIVLAPFVESDITEEYLSWLNDPVLMRFSRQRYQTHTRHSCASYAAAFRDSENRFWSIRDADDTQVGTMTAYLDAQREVADLGILIGSRHLGKGYGSAAWGIGLEWSFKEQELRKVTAGTLAQNVGMVRVALTWGMCLEGVRRQDTIVDGQAMDMLLFGQLREEWLQRLGESL